MTTADKIFRLILDVQRDDEEHPALDHLARALMEADEEEHDRECVDSEDAVRAVYRPAYGAEVYDRREEWIYPWFGYLSRERLVELAQARRLNDDVARLQV